MAEKQKNVNIDRKYWIFALKIIADFGAVIAIPVVVFVIIGQRLDAKFGLAPWCTTAAFVLAALISGKIIYRKSKAYGTQYQDLDTKQ
jgi:hypothetical protein